ncbi:hypothetical protein [Streptomyces sp. NPDC056543]|uniref:hypothetical protein n=1 Tax=unclassified Streptomyces TaxID=2593676 RepID=UPI0036AFBDE2
MSETPGAGPPGTPTTLFDHALRLHRLTPDAPLFRGGAPFPGAERRRGGPERKASLAPTRDGADADADAVKVLDEYFDGTDDDTDGDTDVVRPATPHELAERLRGLPVSARHHERISGAALRAPAGRTREAGRWLVRHGTDTGSVAIGLALLAEAGTVADIGRIQTIGLLSNAFGPLVARALERLPGGVEALIWLAERATEWGRVHAVEALCRHVDDHPAVRPWLLRNAAADGEFLNSYVASDAARVTGLHDVVVDARTDAAVVDQTGRILHVMTYCEGMGTSLRHYPHALTVMEAHVRHLGHLGPTAERYCDATTVSRYLGAETPAWSDDDGLQARWDDVRRSYVDLLGRTEWRDAAREGLAAGHARLTWLVDSVAPELGLRASLAAEGDRPCADPLPGA